MTSGDIEEFKRLGGSNRASDRLRLWNDLIPSVFEDEAFVTAHEADLAALVLKWVFDGGNARLLRSVRNALRRLLGYDGLVRALAGAAIKNAPLAARKSPQAALRMLALCSGVASRLEASSAHKALSKLFETIADLLRVLGQAGWADRRWRRISAAAAPALRGSFGPTRALVAIEILRSTASGSGLLARLLSESAEMWPAADKPAREDARKQLVEIFAGTVLGAREATPEWSLSGWHQVSLGWDASAVGEIVRAAVRAVRRSPEISLPAMTAVLGTAQVDESLEDLAPSLLAAARHARSNVREMAVPALSVVASSINTGDTLKQHLVGPMLESLLASGTSRVKAASDRASLLRAIIAIAATGSDAVREIAGGTIDSLAADYSTETTEECKILVVQAIGEWTEAADALFQSAATRFVAGISEKEKDTLRLAHVRTIARALRKPGVFASSSAVATLVGPLVSLLASGASKVALRPSAVLASLAFARIAGESPGSLSPQVASKAQAALVEAAEKVFSPSAVARLSAEDAESAAEASAALLSLQDAGGLVSGAVRPALVSALTQLLLHHAALARIAASRGSARLLAAEPAASTELVSALSAWMSEPAGVPGSVEATTEDAADVHEHCLPARYFRAFMATLPGSGWRGPPPPELILAVAGAAYTPIISLSRRRGGAEVASIALERLPKISESVADQTGVIIDLALSRLRSSKPNSSGRLVALGTIRALAGISPEISAPALLRGLDPLLDSTEHDELTLRELRIYFTPTGRLSNEGEDGSIIPSEIFECLLLSEAERSRGAIPGSGASFKLAVTPGRERPASNGTSAGGKAPRGGTSRGSAGSAAGKDAAVIARTRQLASEAETRARIAGIVDNISRGADGIAAVAQGAAFYLGSVGALEATAQRVSVLAASSLVGSGPILRALTALAGCLGPSLESSAPVLGGCLRAVAAVESNATELAPAVEGSPARPNYEAIAAQSQFTQAIRALCLAVRVPFPQATADESDSISSAVEVGPPHPLLPHGYVLVLPILRAVLAARSAHALQAPSLALVAEQVRPEAKALLPSAIPATFSLLYAALDAAPAAREAVSALLESMASHVDAADDETFSAVAEGAVSLSLATRTAALRALLALPAIAGGFLADGSRPPRALALMWLARHEATPEIVSLAEDAWKRGNAVLDASSLPALHGVLLTSVDRLRSVAARAIAAAVTGPLVAKLSGVLDGALKSASTSDSEFERLGAATLIEVLAPAVTADTLPGVLDAVLVSGMQDSSPAVRSTALAAGEALIDTHGGSSPDALLARLESALASSAEKPRDAVEGQAAAAHRDAVRTGVVVLLGALAPHLPAGHPRARGIVETLLDVLSTPSEVVQRVVSDRLPPLMKAFAADDAFVAGIVKQLLESCLSGDSYAVRRGAAYGLAGAVRGLGIVALRTRGITDTLKAGIENRSSSAAREGALCAYECLSDKLGRLFEPYVVATLPLLLASFGDPSREVREAAQAASRTIMAQLSAQGVRLVLPSLLAGLNDRAWRTQEGSAQMLGAMAHCAPRQLGTCLPTVVPALGGALSDPHPRVSASAHAALDEVGSVIQNPEVSRLVPALIACITDPSANTRKMLDTLLATVFINTVDIASLALVMPVALRGLKDRSGDVKKRAARIVGTLCGLANDPRDMMPYLPDLIPALRSAAADPLPEVRASAARALGSLVSGLGPDAAPDLTPHLLASLHAEGSGVERAGAAQALAEVLAVLGPDALVSLLPEVLEGTKSRAPAAREGCLTLFRYLPPTMPDAYRMHLAEVLPAILIGLADEAEGVRDAALLAARVAVDLYATSALDLLLPAVEAGIANANWRIRQSSVELLGDLLFKVAGTSGRVQQDLNDDEREGISAEAHGRLIVESLGWERRCDVLALVYMARSDVAFGVRSAALHVWKTVVTNTPKTLGEILPALMHAVIGALADTAEDRRDAAGRCLGELVRKMGERVLAQIMPILRNGMSAPDASTRQGVCNGLRDVVENATREQLGSHLPTLLPAIQSALCDENAGVRAAAGAIFNVMHRTGGPSSVDAVVPALLASLDGNQGRDAALDGLRVLLTVRPALLGAMLPRLVRAPLRTENLRALGALGEAAGSTLPGHLGTVLPPLLALTAQHPDMNGLAAAAHDALRRIVLSVQEDGLHVLVEELLRDLEVPELSVGTSRAIAVLCRGTKLDFQEHVPALLTALIPFFSDDDAVLVSAAWDATAAVAGSIPKETQPSFVRCLKDAVATARDREKRKRAPPPLRVAGCCLPKGLQPVVPVYLQGVLQGASAELRELAAEGLGELVDVTSPEALRPFVVQITGPLIRIIGDRFPWQIKAAILKTLGLLIGKAGIALKPFVPQLQATFLKCLLDPELKVRARAATNLGSLSALSTRLDTLITDLATSARAAEPSAADAYVIALKGALLVSGARISPEVLSRLGSALLDAAQRTGEDEELRASASDAIGAWAAHASPNELHAALTSSGVIGPATASRSGDRLGAALTASAVLRHAPERITPDVAASLVESIATRFVRDPLSSVRAAASIAAGRVISIELERDGGEHLHAMLSRVTSALVALLGGDQTSEVQRCTLAVLRRLSGVDGASERLAPYFPDLVPSVLRIVQDSTGSTKLSAERCLARLLSVSTRPELLEAYLETQTAGSMAKQMLTEVYIRRLTKLPLGDEEEEFAV